MSTTAVSVEGLGKRYNLGESTSQYGMLAESISDSLSRSFRRLTGRTTPENGTEKGHLWALRDVALEVQDGEVLGVVGRNGAGKTTLLKVLSRITEPTTGIARMRGRVGSLLEVGTGFHPELTGRENIYLNGAILGMKRAEIVGRFDEIVAFAEVERFVDTPVKRYSSGMYLRLAFSVAAHLDPDILIVDEVLAVGDAAFQKKCLGKIHNASMLGRTVLFVSHNMATVLSLCDNAVLLDGGEIVARGPTAEVVQDYLGRVEQLTSFSLADRSDRKGDGKIRIKELGLLGPDGRSADYLQSGADGAIVLDYEGRDEAPLKNVVAAISLDTLHGERITTLQNEYVGADFPELPSSGRFVCKLPHVPLPAGLYTPTIFVTVNGTIADWVINAATIRVEQGDFYGTGRYPEPQDGKILVEHEWEHRAS